MARSEHAWVDIALLPNGVGWIADQRFRCRHGCGTERRMIYKDREKSARASIFFVRTDEGWKRVEEAPPCRRRKVQDDDD